MELLSIRRWYTDLSTISELYMDQMPGRFNYFLEPTVRVGKDPRGIVAIPEGRYEITLYNSPRFKMMVPILNNIPGHDYVLIHPGNFEGSINPETNLQEFDSKDCLLPGLTMGTDYVGQSRDAFNLLFPKINTELNTKPVFITIKNTGA